MATFRSGATGDAVPETEIFRALADETRLAIVRMLLGKELCVCHVIDALDMSQPAISHHLKILRQAGVVRDRREGKWIFYRLNPDAFRRIGEVLSVIVKDAEKCERQEPTSPHRL